MMANNYQQIHHCPIFVLGCIDFRFRDQLSDYIQSQHGEVDFDETLLAGGAIDCGAYGGSAAFSSKEEEVKKLTEDLQTSKNLVLEKYPDVEVKMVFLDWDSTEEIN